MEQVNEMLKFDEPMLIRRLASLPRRARVAFAAACAERMAPAYRLFAKEESDHISILEQALGHLWSDPEPRTPTNALESEIEDVMGIIPQEDDLAGVWSQEATNAQNAGMAVTYALRTRLCGDVQEAAWAARVAYEALDNFVINKEHIDTTLPEGEARVVSHHLVQAELARQQADLDDLGETSQGSQEAVFERVGQRAKADATRFFQP